MKKEILYREIEKDLAELDKVLKIAKKEAGVEKAINNVKENMKFQAAQLGEYKKREEEFGQIVIRWSDVLEKLTKQGDLSARIETSKLSDKHKIVGKNINRMADFLQNNIEELRKAIGSYSKVLNKIALGELSARIDVEQLKEEYKLLGESLNAILEIFEYDSNEIKQRDAELSQMVSHLSEVLNKVSQQGDMSARVDLSKLSEKYKQTGEDTNKMISATEENIKKLNEQRTHLSRAISSFDSVLSSASKGDLSSRVDLRQISKEYKQTGENINKMISATKEATEDLESLLKELSTPCIKLWEQIVAMPLVGTMTSDRARDAMETILRSITEYDARVAIIDITGVLVIDTMVADRLIKTLKAIKILGAEPVLTGLSPDIASTLVGIGIELDAVTKPSLADGLGYALEFVNKEIREVSKES